MHVVQLHITQGTKRYRTHNNEEDNSSDKLYKDDVEIEDLNRWLRQCFNIIHIVCSQQNLTK
jgi:hypothetical protein